MVKFFLPKESKIQGKKVVNTAAINAKKPKVIEIYRWSPDSKDSPHIYLYNIDMDKCSPMVLDVLDKIKAEIDPTLAFRKSCREGICGSCAVNINGRNRLACITPVSTFKENIKILPLPHLEVIRDLIPDLTHFYAQYAMIKPWIQSETPTERNKEQLQSPEDRKKLDGLYECILCACCSTSCPSYWWKSEKYLGPSALLNAYRWIADSRDENRKERLDSLNDAFRLFRCYGIMNCVEACPKNLHPAKAISNIKKLLLQQHYIP
ncbi:succinate:quinone oxidoreductase, iron-sulfur cluster binding protein [Candidatus Xenohaliotis californiensis]|uniref:Succinate dehydrogenase iron-sulfur subunit n=1 Tax=Candidatus Xenohaliotis californiensis TaxID=84677 RepID=A0ABP0EXM6_9RICK|nr:succinate:quinone oxidoreductase, iron-sulfur cluster binding protein [Candidatus Xenohaliotis californiensis]